METAFSCIKIHNYCAKPRQKGLTSLIDKGLDCEKTHGLIAAYGDYIDIIKLGFGTARLFPKQQLTEKIKLLTTANIWVCPGGTLFEIAVQQNVFEPYLEECKALGFNAFEISDGVIPISLQKRLQIVKQVEQAGFKVFVEIGRKDEIEDAKLSLDDRIHESKAFLDAGVEKVIIEARESGNVGLFDNKKQIKTDEFDLLTRAIKPEQLIFEAPEKHQQAWLINKLGSHVNLGNIAPAEILALTCLRFNLRADTIHI